MIILRQNNYSFKDIAKTIFKGAVKELGKKYADETKSGDIFGILVIDRFVDKSRFIGKTCKFKINSSDNSVEGNWDGGHIYWDLSEEFEPLENCPHDWKEFTVTGEVKDGETIPARIVQKNGKILNGSVLCEVR